MAQVQVKKNSWLNLTSLLRWNDYTFWDHFDYPEIPYNDNDLYVQLTSVGTNRIDLIANDLYGDPELMWIILLANNVDYPNQFYNSQTIRLPALETVTNILATKKE